MARTNPSPEPNSARAAQPSRENAAHAPTATSRRRFLKELAAAAAVPAVLGTPAGAGTAQPGAPRAQSGAAAGAVPPLPSIQLGTHRISRLVAGSNPFHGGSYQGPHTDNAMREYFTTERKVEFLEKCERAGITAHQFSQPKRVDYLRLARERGVNMQFFGLADSVEPLQDAVREYSPIAMVHHGGVTDRLFAQGKHRQVHDFVKAAHDLGILAGVSAHNPDCIKRIADEGWEVDFFMTCLYFLTRPVFPGAVEKAPPVPTLELSNYRFHAADPAAMTAVVRQVRQPCFVFKILAAGRKAANPKQVTEAFRYAYSNIKPTDGVIVGMYPRYSDEIVFNAETTRRFGQVGASTSAA